MVKEKLYYKFDEGTGTSITDSSGNGYTGTATSMNWATGKVGPYCGTFSSSVVAVPNDVGYTTQVSVFAWWKYNGAAPGNYQIICGGQELEISIPDATGNLRTGVYTSAGRSVDEYSASLNDGNWHLIGFTFDQATGVKRVYKDGALIGTTTGITGTLTYSFANRTIGRFGSSTTYYANGWIDDYRIYNVILNDEQILWLYCLGLGRIQSLEKKYNSEFIWLKMNATDGSMTVPDYGLSGNIGTIVNSTIRTVYGVTASANSYQYEDMTSVTDYTIQSGDYLEYDIYWETSGALIAFDFTTTAGNNLRDSGAVDQNSVSAHPTTDLNSYAYGKWYHRKISLAARVGTTINYYDLACENDTTGSIIGNFKDIKITDGAGTVRKAIYTTGTPTYAAHLSNSSSFTSGTNYTNRLPHFEAGKLGTYAVKFDGQTVVTTPYVGDLAEWSMSAWIYDIKGTGYRAIMQINSASDDAIYLYADDNIGFWPKGETSGAPISKDTWTHVAVTYNSVDGFVFYVNGSSVGTLGTSADAQDWDYLYLGGVGITDTECWVGYMNDFRLFKRTLTSSDVSFIYRSGNGCSNSLADNYGGEAGYYQFNEGSGSKAVDSSRYGNNAVITGFSYATGKVGAYCLDCDGSGNVNLGTPEELQITGSQTICMWIKPNNFSGRQNPYAKAYGGEGTITQETSGLLNYYWGTTGGNSGTSGVSYQGIGNGKALIEDEWQWVCLVRDLEKGYVYWYHNNNLTSTTAALFTQATAGSLSAYVGYGYAGTYDGYIDDVRVYPFALGEAERKFIYNNGNGNSNSLPLKMWMPLLEGSGSKAEDCVSLEYTGEINSANWVSGPISGGLYFDGTADSMEILPFYQADDEFSISFYHKRSSHSASSSWRTLFCRSGGSYHYCLYNPDTTGGVIGIYNAGWVGSNMWVPDDGCWHHYVFVYSASSVKVYVDGVYRGVTASMFDSETYKLNVIGNYIISGGSQPAGYLAEPKFYNRILTDTEIMLMYANNNLLRMIT